MKEIETRRKGEPWKQPKMQKERNGEHMKTIWAGTLKADLPKPATVRWLECEWKDQKEEIK